ncbi:hypothetical protein HN588_08120 [Candidatus Bathyarchaeota archaeon]|nr:hypothetical protein [Candidatus Bathyarchaeota archaeon]
MLGCYDGQCVQSDEGDIDLDSYDETEQEDEEGEIVCTQEQRICLDGSNAEPVEGTCNQFCPEDTYRWCSEDFCRPCQDNHRCQADVVICENDRDRLIHLEGVCELGYCTYHVESCGGYGCGEYRDETMCFNHSQPDGDEDNLGDYAVDELPYDPDGVWCMFSGCPGGQQAIYWWGGRNGDETRVDCGQAFFLSYEGVCGWSSNEFHFNSTSYTALLTVTCNPEVTVDTIDGLEGTTKRRATVPYACF